MKGNVIFLKGKNAAGNLVFYTRAGQQISRGRPEFVRNPNTPAQVLRRAYLKYISGLARQFDRATDIGFSVLVDALHSSRNFFVKKNYENLSGTADVVEIAWDKVQLTEPNPEVNGVALGEPNFATPLQVTVPIDDDYSDPDYGKATDVGFFIVINKTNNQAISKTLASVRAADHVDIAVPGNWQGAYVEVYGFVYRGTPSEAICSETIYCGTGRIA